MTKPILISYFGLQCSHSQLSQVKSCDKRVQTPGMSPPRAGAWTYCLFTP